MATLFYSQKSPIEINNNNNNNNNKVYTPKANFRSTVKILFLFGIFSYRSHEPPVSIYLSLNHWVFSHKLLPWRFHSHIITEIKALSARDSAISASISVTVLSSDLNFFCSFCPMSMAPTEGKENAMGNPPILSPPHLLPITTATPASGKGKKLTLIPLIFLIYFEVAGGPYGEEPAVQAAGPLLALLGFLIFPFIWSVPEALITAELSTAFPGDGGFVIWAHRAFGPFFGSLMGSWKFLSGVINVAAFPVMCIDYLKKVIHPLESGWRRKLAIMLSTCFLSFLNFTGLAIVGYFAVFLAIISLSPFIIMCLMAIPKIHPRRWVSLGQKGVKKDWNLFFNTLFWNLNFWDNVSTLAGEVEKPQKTFPLALFVAVIFTCLSYLFPLVAVIGAVSVDQNQWGSGFHADAAEIIAGKWLKFWIEVGAVLSAIGLFEAQLSSCSYQLLGMADLGILPKFFSIRSRFDTPWVGILISTLITLGVSYMTFTDIVALANFLYSLGMLLEFASFLWLRRKSPQLKRPFRIPLNLPGLILMCLIPSGFLILIMVIATKTVYLVSGLMTVGAIGWYFLMKFCKAKNVFKFSDADDQEFEE